MDTETPSLVENDANSTGFVVNIGVLDGDRQRNHHRGVR